MKRLLFLLLFSTSFMLYGQVVNFPKTLPVSNLSRGIVSLGINAILR